MKGWQVTEKVKGFVRRMVKTLITTASKDAKSERWIVYIEY